MAGKSLSIYRTNITSMDHSSIRSRVFIISGDDINTLLLHLALDMFDDIGHDFWVGNYGEHDHGSCVLVLFPEMLHHSVERFLAFLFLQLFLMIQNVASDLLDPLPELRLSHCGYC